MIQGLLGIKLGMTRTFNEKGEVIPITLIQAGPCPIVQIKTKDKDGYNALQIAYGSCKEKNVPKPLVKHFEKSNLKPYRWLKEFKVDKLNGFSPGQEIKVDIFSPGELVDVSGITKGKGFAGVVKRHNFAGGPRTHGQSDRLRAPGAIGSQRPQRVKKGTRMAGHMGGEWKTIQRLEVVQVDTEKNLLTVKGSVPGNKYSLLVIKKTTRPLKPKVKIETEKHIPKGKGKAPKAIPKKK